MYNYRPWGAPQAYRPQPAMPTQAQNFARPTQAWGGQRPAMPAQVPPQAIATALRAQPAAQAYQNAAPQASFQGGVAIARPPTPQIPPQAIANVAPQAVANAAPQAPFQAAPAPAVPPPQARLPVPPTAFPLQAGRAAPTLPTMAGRRAF